MAVCIWATVISLMSLGAAAATAATGRLPSADSAPAPAAAPVPSLKRSRRLSSLTVLTPIGLPPHAHAAGRAHGRRLSRNVQPGHPAVKDFIQRGWCGEARPRTIVSG